MKIPKIIKTATATKTVSSVKTLIIISVAIMIAAGTIGYLGYNYAVTTTYPVCKALSWADIFAVGNACSNIRGCQSQPSSCNGEFMKCGKKITEICAKLTPPNVRPPCSTDFMHCFGTLYQQMGFMEYGYCYFGDIRQNVTKFDCTTRPTTVPHQSSLWCANPDYKCCTHGSAFFLDTDVMNWHNQYPTRDVLALARINNDPNIAEISGILVGAICVEGCPMPTIPRATSEKTDDNQTVYVGNIAGTEIKGTLEFVKAAEKMFDRIAVANNCNPIPPNCRISSTFRPGSSGNCTGGKSAHALGLAIDIACSGGVSSGSTCTNTNLNNAISMLGGSGFSLIRECTTAEKTGCGDGGTTAIAHLDLGSRPTCPRPSPCAFYNCDFNSCTGY